MALAQLRLLVKILIANGFVLSKMKNIQLKLLNGLNYMAFDRAYSEQVLSSLHKSIESALKRGAVCCPNCENFAAMQETCKLNNKKPPAPVIAFGCERFVYNDIPF